MKVFALIVFVLAALAALATADYHHKKLKIKHVWKKHDDHGYGHGGGHGYGHGKKLVGHSSRYHVQHHGKPSVMV